jgi:hypothetical protein
MLTHLLVRRSLPNHQCPSLTASPCKSCEDNKRPPQAIMNCVRANICRSLPPQTEDYDPEEDEPVLEPSWPHLQVVYEFFLRFVVSSEVNAKVAKKYVDANFCYR